MPLNSEERENPKAQKGAKKSGYLETALLVKKLMVFPGFDGLTPGRNLKSVCVSQSRETIDMGTEMDNTYWA